MIIIISLDPRFSFPLLKSYVLIMFKLLAAYLDATMTNYCKNTKVKD